MESYDGAETCGLVGTYILPFLSKFIDKSNCGLYRNDGLIHLKSNNGQKMDKIRKLIINSFKDIGCKIEINTNLKTIDFLDVSLNLSKGAYSPFKKPNDKILFSNTLSNQTPQVIKHLSTLINERLSKTLSNEEIFNKSKARREKDSRKKQQK